MNGDTFEYGPGEPRPISPPRIDPFDEKNKKDSNFRTFKNALVESSETGHRERKRRWDVRTPDNSEHLIDSKASETSKWDVQNLKSAESLKQSRWDQTPSRDINVVNFGFSTPGGFFPSEFSQITADVKQQREIESRNKPFTDEVLDSLLPTSGYKIADPPLGYVPLITPSRKLTSTPKMNESLFQDETSTGIRHESLSISEDLPPMKMEDVQFFGKLLDEIDENKATVEELKERKILKLLLKIKNGNPQARRQGLRMMSEKALELGPGPTFDALLPLMLSPTLDEQERHVFVKLVDRLLFKFDYLVRPFVHKILVVIEPLLIEEDFFVRTEGREILSNLAKAAGLATMISAMRPDIEHSDEYVRNVTARAFAIVGSALGVDSIIPFLSAVCKSKKSWQARHTGLKIIQQLAILKGCSIVPFLPDLSSQAESLLSDDDQPKVRIMAALALSALAECSYPFGGDIFKGIMDKFWNILKNQKGKSLAACLKAFGFISRLLDIESCNFYVSNLFSDSLLREFDSHDDDLKRIILGLLKQLAIIKVMDKRFWSEKILPLFLKTFWTRKVSNDRRSYRLLNETTLAIANITGEHVVFEGLIFKLKDENEVLRKAAADSIERICRSCKVSVIDLDRISDQLIDALSFAFQEQTIEDKVIINGIAVVLEILGNSGTRFHTSLVSMTLWRLSNKSTVVRQMAACLAGVISPSLCQFGSEALASKLGMILYENLGEEYPEVLGSILKAMVTIALNLGLSRMSPSPREILPRLTPILRNRHERVQEHCVEFIGVIAERSPEVVNAKEWMRICFELLDLLKAPRKGIRKATVRTFGQIAKAIGPSDVLIALLNNLKVQERQNRVCTTIAIAIVAENCGPFTVIPALMNEYRVPELNIQNGVLKACSFLFEYIGESSKDYIYAITSLLEDALTDRDLIHRQTASSVVRHASIGAAGYGCEEALIHFLNHLLPNIFETSPHVIFSIIETLDSLRISLGSCVLFAYILQGLYHPARRVREAYWRVYNNLYIANPEALIQQYPMISDEDGCKYSRNYLYIAY